MFTLCEVGDPWPMAGTRYKPAMQSILDVTNTQKLSLPANTPVGTQVRVSDGFTCGGAGSSQANGLFIRTSIDAGYSHYTQADHLDSEPDTYAFYHQASSWNEEINADVLYTSTDAAEPWLAVFSAASGSNPPPTLTYPGLQQLATPSTAQAAVAVLGGTMDGIYTPRGTHNGKEYFNLLGSGEDTTASVAIWSTNLSDDFGAGPSAAGWALLDNAPEFKYYSLSAVATPDLASNWKNASDDSPASITVMSLTVGQLVSGWKLGSVVYAVNGNQNGRNLYHDVLGIAADIGWDGTKWTDGTTNGSANTAFPDIGTADPVAAEANWQTA